MVCGSGCGVEADEKKKRIASWMPQNLYHSLQPSPSRTRVMSRLPLDKISGERQ